jgi:hypothetical protein
MFYTTHIISLNLAAFFRSFATYLFIFPRGEKSLSYLHKIFTIDHDIRTQDAFYTS